MPTERIDQEKGRLSEPLRCAGFWPRFASLLLDGFIMAPIGLLAFWMPTPRFLALFYFLLIFLLALFCEVYLVRRWGGTPGKLVMDLRILRTDGRPVGYREATLRAGPNLIFNPLGAVALCVAASQVTVSHYRATPFLNRLQQLANLAPRWHHSVDVAFYVWSWGELLVLLSNRRRRALHDFIAGTVVVILHGRQVSVQSGIAFSDR